MAIFCIQRMSEFVRIRNSCTLVWFVTYKPALKLEIMPIQFDIINILCTIRLPFCCCFNFAYILSIRAREWNSKLATRKQERERAKKKDECLLGCILKKYVYMYICIFAGQINNRATIYELARGQAGPSGEQKPATIQRILALFMIMNARQHIYVKIMQFAAVLCECVD